MLEKISGVVAPIAALLLGFSVIFDFFYLSALGVGFETIGTDISDHVRTAIIWAPFAFIMAIVGLIWAATNASEQPKPIGFRAISARRFALLLVGDLCFSVPVILFVSAIGGMLILGSSLYFSFFGQEIYEQIKHRFPNAHFLVVGLPALALLLGAAGWSRGELILRSTTPTIRVVFADATSTPINALGLRRFNSSTVIVEDSHKILVVKSDEIKTVESIEPRDGRTALCRYFGVKCLP